MSLAGVSEQPMLEWSLPVIFDCLVEFYSQKLPYADNAVNALARRHFSLWTALIGDLDAELSAERMQLEAQARALRMDSQIWRVADRYVAAEILDLSLRRFRRMPQEARINNRALLALLMRLQNEASFAFPRSQSTLAAPPYAHMAPFARAA